MKTKFSFSLKYLGLNGILILLIFVLNQLNFIDIPPNQFKFILACSILVVMFSLTVILPAIGGKKEAFILQFMILTVMQLLFMLSISAYEVYNWGKPATEAILFQLTPFIWLLIIQSILLYKYSQKS